MEREGRKERGDGEGGKRRSWERGREEEELGEREGRGGGGGGRDNEVKLQHVRT